MVPRLEGKVALVTGAARGHGRAHAQRLAREGADIVALDIAGPVDPAVTYAPSTLDELAQTAKLVEAEDRRVLTVQGDVREASDLDRAVAAAEAEFGGIDIVIANAGVNVVGRTAELDEAAWDAVIDTNLKGVWNTVRAVVPGMVARGRGGSIVLVSSNAGISGLTRMSPYVASKHGVTGLARAFANEYAVHSIRVNSIHPGSVPGTGMAISQPLEFTDSEEEALFLLGTRGATLPGTILVEDIAAAAAWLASDDARFVTGAQIPIDAGSSAKP